MAKIFQPVDEPLFSQSAQTPAKDVLTRLIDDHLERYLHLLDQYQILQENISHQFSAGFLSLAQANFSSPYRSRYGQDYYDDRMKASTQVSVKPLNPSFSTSIPTGPATSTDSDFVETSPSQPKSADPLRWFGILVPPPLKACQKEFEAVVRNDVLPLANVAKEMKEIELELRRTRKKLKKLG